MGKFDTTAALEGTTIFRYPITHVLLVHNGLTVNIEVVSYPLSSPTLGKGFT